MLDQLVKHRLVLGWRMLQGGEEGPARALRLNQAAPYNQTRLDVGVLTPPRSACSRTQAQSERADYQEKARPLLRPGQFTGTGELNGLVPSDGRAAELVVDANRDEIDVLTNAIRTEC